MLKITNYFLKISLAISLAIFLIWTLAFFALKYGWTNVAGGEDKNSVAYNALAQEEQKKEAVLGEKIASSSSEISTSTIATTSLPVLANFLSDKNLCYLIAAAKSAPNNADIILKTFRAVNSEELLARMLLALKLRLGENSEFSQSLANCDSLYSIANFTEQDLNTLLENASTTPNFYVWQNGEPWQIIRQAIVKDKEKIEEAAKLADIQPRMLVSVAIVEQLRLYYTQRELYEKFFRPLKVLANANKMAWGIMSIKEKMAKETEAHLVDQNSPYYLGLEKEILLNYAPEDNVDKKRYERLTDEHNHFYSYLYGALILRQFQAQWQKAGYDLYYRPEILATLFNIGFNHSEPKAEPMVGGSTLNIEEQKYYFGALAYEFYYSGDLQEVFLFK